MKIKYVEIQNFRKLKSVRIELSDKTTIFVGANNSGKTSAIVALGHFLVDPRRFTTKDFTLSIWRRINKIGEEWISCSNRGESPELSMEQWMDNSPSLDVWLSVGPDEVHHVSHLIPTLDWAGGLIGVRLQFGPKDLAELQSEFVVAAKNARQTLEDAKASANDLNEGLKLWPQSLSDFIDRRLHRHFGLQVYLLDQGQIADPENGVARPQTVPAESDPLEPDPFRGLIRIDEVTAQRGFWDAGATARPRDGRSTLEPRERMERNQLSDQLRRYYDRHVDPTEAPDVSDLVSVRKVILLIHDTPLGKAYVLGTFLTREVTDMGFKVASRVRGLSDEAFREAFGAEEQCRSALSRLRWPDGFVCPACGHRGHCVLAGRSLYQCYRCKKQTSSTAGTIFHATKLPLTLWFAAVHLIVTAKNGISSVELGRRLGVKQPTAWTMKHKIMAVMARREADTPLSGRVEMDDAYLGGARAGGKRGRGAPGKTPFVAAVSTSPEGRPRKVKLVPVKGFRKREIARGAKRWLAPGSEVLTDGLRCWNALDGVVGSHRAIRTGSGRQAARMAPFKWVNTTLGNIKSAITGTYRKLGPDHAQRYLASFAWRYNRRYQLNTMIPRFVHSAARTQPIPYRALIAG